MSGKTSNESKIKYDKKTYHAIAVTLKKDDDSEIIAYIEKNKKDVGTTQLFRNAMQFYMNELNKAKKK